MEENLENHQNNYRYERKYLLKISNSGLFMKKLYLNNFEEIYSPRKVNNIYYDTINLSSLTETKEGLSNRVKYRVRWYGETFKKSNKNLELKIKSEFLNRKKSYFIGNLKFHSPITKNLKMLNNLIQENLLKVKDNFYTKTSNLERAARSAAHVYCPVNPDYNPHDYIKKTEIKSYSNKQCPPVPDMKDYVLKSTIPPMQQCPPCILS